MGIVNVTPDSFSDAGDSLAPESAVAKAWRLIEEGAAIIDVGAESTRPGATPVALADELSRLLPVLHGLRDSPVPISVDTYKPDVMRAALDAGASIINDIFGFRDTAAIDVVSKSNAGVVVMHMQGTPPTMQSQVHYDDVVKEVESFLRHRLSALALSGIEADRVVIDPGFGFGKRLVHNQALLAHLSSYGALGAAGVLAGLSRKGMLGTISGKDEPAKRLGSSIAAALLAVSQGANIVRCHDVAATVDAIKVWCYFSGGGGVIRPPAESDS